MEKTARTYRLLRPVRFAGLAFTAGLMLFSASSAMAHDRVNWSVGIGIGAPPAVVYQQPEVVYAQPEVIYAQPRVVYRQAPVVEYREYRDWRREHAWREHERREHAWREHEWRERHDHDGWRHD